MHTYNQLANKIQHEYIVYHILLVYEDVLRIYINVIINNDM